MDLNSILAFVFVVKHGSYTSAAKKLKTTKSKLSRQILALEEHLQQQLIRRTTRQLSLTEAGQIFFNTNSPLVEQILNSEKQLLEQQEEPSGSLTITCPTAVGTTLLASKVSEFSLRYPKVKLDIILSDFNEDLIGRGIDCAIRGGRLDNSNLKCRGLFTTRLAFYATPQYIELHGEPQLPEELNKHRLLILSRWSNQRVQLRYESKKYHVKLNTLTITANNILFIKETMLASGGIAILPRFIGEPYVEKQELVRVLSEYQHEENRFYLVYPDNPYLPPAFKAFQEFITNAFQEDI